MHLSDDDMKQEYQKYLKSLAYSKTENFRKFDYSQKIVGMSEELKVLERR